MTLTPNKLRQRLHGVREKVGSPVHDPKIVKIVE